MLTRSGSAVRTCFNTCTSLKEIVELGMAGKEQEVTCGSGGRNPRLLILDTANDLTTVPIWSLYRFYTGRFGVFKIDMKWFMPYLSGGFDRIARELQKAEDGYMVIDWINGKSSIYFKSQGIWNNLVYVNDYFCIGDLVKSHISRALTDLLVDMIFGRFARAGNANIVSNIKNGAINAVDVVFKDHPDWLFFLP